MNPEYQRCTQCVMDTTDPQIVFDGDGICNHCHKYELELPKRVFRGDEAKEKLNTIVSKIQFDAKGREYDCIVGVSGGVDSTYVVYLVKELGLRPLAIHFDNGWNSELSVSNIKKVLDVLKVDLYTYVIDWETFKGLQMSFLKASTPDGEIPTDHAINALLFHEAARRGIKYIISGMNYATESTGVPDWAYGHMDWKYIRSVNKEFGGPNLKNYPHLNFFQLGWWTLIRRIKVVSILNYITYDKAEAMQVLQNKLGWVYYGGKHYESVYTRFFQGYILPRKYGIDKRIIHLADLIHSGQMTRDAAVLELQRNDYLNGPLAEEDKLFFCKKFNIGEREFSELMSLPNKSFRNYDNSYDFVAKLKRAVNYLRHRGWVSK